MLVTLREKNKKYKQFILKRDHQHNDLVHLNTFLPEFKIIYYYM